MRIIIKIVYSIPLLVGLIFWNNSLLRGASIEQDMSVPAHFLPALFEQGDLNALQEIMRRPHIDVNEVIVMGDREITLLQWMVEKQCLAGIEVLVAMPTLDINKATAQGTALQMACSKGYRAIVQRLLNDSRIDVNRAGPKGITPLISAVVRERHDIIEDLLAVRDIDINKRGIKGLSALSSALALKKDSTLVKRLLKAPGIEVNGNEQEISPLMHAVCSDNKEGVDLLLADGRVELNSINDFEQTALTHASSKNNTAMIFYLLKVGAIAGRYTVLLQSAQEGDYQIVDALLSLPDIDMASINKGNRWGKNALMLAIKGGHLTIVQRIIRLPGIDINKVCRKSKGFYPSLITDEDQGYTPLHMAVHYNHEAIVGLLMQESGIQVNALNDDRETPLLMAIQKGSSALVHALLMRDDVDVDGSSTENGISAIVLAQSVGNTELEELLKAYKYGSFVLIKSTLKK